ncbi:hypothetical protein BDY19DRAFT_966276 [Irpex rosettiformis]|uniref:Uncharacterized protein n=1 Tax=Irpex rosettiformis TaxID=378272 RepID=A0ACB8TTS4_9APHY|nr:hypothetical protein BDY19DRAFT_966276 [Irpex rosettiformis]
MHRPRKELVVRRQLKEFPSCFNFPVAGSERMLPNLAAAGRPEVWIEIGRSELSPILG